MPEHDQEATITLTTSGTEAASPHALAAGSKGAASLTPTPNPTAMLKGPGRPQIHLFHLFAAVMPLAAIALAIGLGGDPTARLAMCLGLGVLSLCNAGLVWMTATAKRFRPRVAEALWLLSVVAAQPVLLFFGPFSGAVMVDVFGILFVSFGRTRWISLATMGLCVAGHLVVALPILFGWIHDRGLLTSAFVEYRYQLWVCEALVMTFLVMGYIIGRWARRTNAAAMMELQGAMRIIGDREQALAEVKDEVARVERVDEGRWTGHVMGSYKLGLVLGRGAMGEVYEATGPNDSAAAVKLVNARSQTSPSLIERFHREMEVAVRLASPHIVKVFELSAPDAPVAYIAMERLYGIDLATRLRSDNRMPFDEVAVLLDQVARGLEVARLANVVHRDLKPHNLFHHEGTTWKILDFGVSKLVGSDGTLTGEGIVGTPQYMAPEQASGEPVTHLADVYALGAIAYRCITGRSLFKGKDLAELVYQVVHAPPERPSTFARVSIAIEDVLAVAMAKDPRRRFSSALSFAQAFASARRGRIVPVEPPPSAWK